MSKEMIGLKLADGEFYPVLEDAVEARKRLVVTTVQDGQRSVQIDLYRGEGPRVDGSEYIGSLVIEGIPEMAKGEPDIRMDLGLADDGTLTAFAQEASTGASQSLKVSLKSLAEEEKYEVPDFRFSGATPLTEAYTDKDFEGTDSLPSQEDSAQLLAGVHDESEAAASDRPRSRIILFIIIGVIAAAALVALGFLIFRPGTGGSAVPPAASAAPEPVPTQPAPAPAPAPVEPAAAAAPEPAPAAEPAPPPPPAEPAAPERKPGVNYKIKWGDTLWELSYAFYRNPWYFGKIALANKIKNPDKIIAGRTIWIPPR
jgi:hypothetical protein